MNHSLNAIISISSRTSRVGPLLCALLVCARMVVADDWATYQHDNAHTGRSSADFDPTLLQKAWGSTEFSHPIVIGNSVFAYNSSQGRIGLASLNLLNGQQLWRKGLEGNFASSLTYAEGLLI